MIKQVASILVTIALLASAFLGIQNGWDDLHHSHTGAQRFVSCLVIAYGILSLIALAGFLLKQSWVVVAMIVWGIFVTASAYLSTVIWGEAGFLTGAVAGGSAAAVVTIPIYYVWRTFRKKSAH